MNENTLILVLKIALGVLAFIGVRLFQRYYKQKGWRKVNKLFAPEVVQAIHNFYPAQAVVERREDKLTAYCKSPFDDLNRRIFGRITLLHLAAALGRKDSCKILMKYGVNIYEQGADMFPTDEQGLTPVEWAKKFRHRHTARMIEKYAEKHLKK